MGLTWGLTPGRSTVFKQNCEATPPLTWTKAPVDAPRCPPAGNRPVSIQTMLNRFARMSLIYLQRPAQWEKAPLAEVS